MGIRSRDYMKRPSDDDGERSSPDDKVEALLSGFFQRHPKFFLYLGIAFVVMLLIAILVAKFT